MKTGSESIFLSALQEAAVELADSLHSFGRLGGNGPRSSSQRNTVIHLGAALINQGFAVCVEPSPVQGKRRVDLVASNGQDTFFIEVRALGNSRWKEIQADFERIYRYEPSTDGLEDGEIDDVDPLDHRTTSTRRWSCMVIQSHSRHSRMTWRSLMRGLTEGSGDFCELADFLQARNAALEEVPVYDGRLIGGSPLYLFSAMFESERRAVEALMPELELTPA